MDCQRSTGKLEYNCCACGFNTTNKTDYKRHVKTKKHLELTAEAAAGAGQREFNCVACDYHTDHRSLFMRHLKTAKHAMNTAPGGAPAPFQCDLCRRTYKYKSGLTRHRKTCGDLYADRIIEAMKGHISEELGGHISEQVTERIGSQLTAMAAPRVVNSTTTNITNNNTVVINFLNTNCADAMNINDFMEQLKITFSELQHMGQNGFNKSAKSIITDRLGNMDVTKRPIHCTDRKRKTMYVRKDDIWRKDPEHRLVRGSMRHLHCKSMDAVEEAEREKPGYFDDAEHARQRNDIIISMSKFDPADQKAASAFIAAVSRASHLTQKDMAR
jgi:hypothetical protein